MKHCTKTAFFTFSKLGQQSFIGKTLKIFQIQALNFVRFFKGCRFGNLDDFKTLNLVITPKGFQANNKSTVSDCEAK